MRVIIAGAGRIGVSLGSTLLSAGHQVTLIEREESRALRITETHGLYTLTGDATDAEILHQAEVGRADVVAAMLHRDADNLAVALLAQSAGAKRVMVRMRDSAYRPVYKGAGVHRVLSETDVFVGVFGTAIEYEAVRHAMLVGYGASIAFELVVPSDSVVVGRTVAEITGSAGFPDSCVFAGLYTAGGYAQRIRGAATIEPGMSVLLVAPRDVVPSVVSYFMQRRKA